MANAAAVCFLLTLGTVAAEDLLGAAPIPRLRVRRSPLTRWAGTADPAELLDVDYRAEPRSSHRPSRDATCLSERPPELGGLPRGLLLDGELVAFGRQAAHLDGVHWTTISATSAYAIELGDDFPLFNPLRSRRAARASDRRRPESVRGLGKDARVSIGVY
jgi:hypothetical protein